jgi:anti-anti-sigma regulatory factor
MATIAVFLKVDEQCVAQSLHDAAEKLDSAAGEAVVDFSLVRRIDSDGLRALKELARVAELKAVKIVLRDVNVDVFKTLKLARLTQPFLFEN